MKNNNNEYKMPLEFVKKVKDTLTEKESLEGELKYIEKEGHEIWFQNSIMPILDDDGQQIGEVIVRYDITEKKKFQQMAITDPLTNLYNRRYFNKILIREIKRSQRDKTHLAFMMIDIDYFKKYNDSYGHKAGDNVLVAVANTLKNSSKRASDFVFRLGGEEFAILFTTEDEKKAFAFTELVKKNIEKLQIPHSNSQVSKYITVSIGLLVVDFKNEMVDENGFYTMADDALYEAKAAGRNQVTMHKNEELDFF
ncbi:sensor domain-containing diguanylate cyclase [Sulfurimonas autotrophica]|uniref:diguanylate cyclase n=1 Tax=Sulfurimonas autotrophica (strain ATCC BAA-671 / DSM 16294 / JCM 11897 / OK10) TaxID=563040 RepID=E0USE4_SULAO|nr:GGDEF domain-containing protein [Sulfurimonas autotrophica]ADN09107.1 diguanylate cyclase [Sulfurimonas autotrophica DSM 16294]